MADPTYRYLDLRPGPSAWPGAAAYGTVYDDDDCVRLAPVAAEPQRLADIPGLTGVTAAAVAADGTVYLADPDGHQILVVACDGSIAPFACLGPPLVHSPRGVVVGPRDRLYIADGGDASDKRAGRVLVFHRRTGTLVDEWTHLGDPVDLAVDSADRIYVVDSASGRILRLDADGVVDADFTPVVDDAATIATTVLGGEERLIVVSATGSLVVFHLDGSEDEGSPITAVAQGTATSVAADADALYVSTPSGILSFSASGSFLGVVSGAAAATLALDCRGRLIFASAAGAFGVSAAGRAREGRLLLGPLPLVDGIPAWDRVVVERAGPATTTETHVRLWIRTSHQADTPALPPATPEPGESRPGVLPDTWRAAPVDAPDSLVLAEPAPYLWVCIDLSGDGRATPAIRSIRVDHLGTGLPGKLPAIYSAADVDETTHRLVHLLAAPLDEVGADIRELATTFDAAAAETSRLPELARWLGQPIDVRRSEAEHRQSIAEAFRRHGHRGTRAELERMLGDAAGTPVRISEPAAEVRLWTLGTSLLGSDSMLIPAEAQGAVVGTTAEVDGSHLIPEEDIGWPLNVDVAHRFRVHVSAATLTRDAEVLLRQAIEREKPAHTLAAVCIAEPAVTVGIGRIGKDMVVGGTCPADHPHTDMPVAVGDRIGTHG